MFIYFLMIILLALHLSVKFHSFWSCFGRVQKWLKCELNSHLNYFSVLKNAQRNLFNFCTNPGLQLYVHISHNHLQFLCVFALLFLFEEIEKEQQRSPATSSFSNLAAQPIQPNSLSLVKFPICTQSPPPVIPSLRTFSSTSITYISHGNSERAGHMDTVATAPRLPSYKASQRPPRVPSYTLFPPPLSPARRAAPRASSRNT